MPVPLWLHLKLSGLGRHKQAPAPDLPDQPQRIWLHLSPECLPRTAQLLVDALQESAPDAAILISGPRLDADMIELPDAAQMFADIADSVPDVRQALSHIRPDLIVLLGFALPAALITQADMAQVPIVLADVYLPDDHPSNIPYASHLLQRIHTILTRDPASAQRLIGMGAVPNRIASCGALDMPAAPLGHLESERNAIGALLRARQLWLAAAVPEAELDWVLQAHSHALRHAHRLMLLLAPDRPGDAVALYQRLAAQGWSVARRSLEGEPDQHTQIFIADDPDDFGLWYRLSPITYMGGTLTGAALHPRSPSEPAALGSAILHGPRTEAFAKQYQRLKAARATKRIVLADALGDALANLLDPDRAALLAHNAWAAETEGAGALQTVTGAISALLRKDPPATPQASATAPPFDTAETRNG